MRNAQKIRSHQRTCGSAHTVPTHLVNITVATRDGKGRQRDGSRNFEQVKEVPAVLSYESSPFWHIGQGQLPAVALVLRTRDKGFVPFGKVHRLQEGERQCA
jgi:hypothetical protein